MDGREDLKELEDALSIVEIGKLSEGLLDQLAQCFGLRREKTTPVSTERRAREIASFILMTHPQVKLILFHTALHGFFNHLLWLAYPVNQKHIYKTIHNNAEEVFSHVSFS